MASNLIERVGKGGLDAPLAALAALAAGFVVYAMPADLFERIVVTSGLPSLLAAAQPPLGQTARLAAGALVVLTAFGAVYALLRLVDRPPHVRSVEAKSETSAPAVRRRRLDIHPDAPECRPLFAASDLGEPAGIVPDFVPPEPAPPEPAPPEPVASSRPAAPEPYRPESIADLMARLEKGIAARNARARIPPPSPPASPEPDAEVRPADALDARLRSAIDSLHRFNAHQN